MSTKHYEIPTDPERKVPFWIKIGYTLGSIGDSTAYNIVISFLSFFLTTIAGISPAVAGTIISVAIAWDAITDPIIGLMIDNSKSKKGKRRPFIKMSIIPMAVSISCLFLKVNFAQPYRNIYYLVVVLVFWTCYTMFNIPYYSLGSVLTKDDDERTIISGWREVMGFIGVFCGTSVTTFIVGKLKQLGMTEEKSWFVAAIVASAICLVTIFIMWKATEGWEASDEQEVIAHEKLNFGIVLNEIKTLMCNKAYVVIILSALFCNVFMTLFYSDMLYYTSFVMGLEETKSAILYTVMSACSIIMIPFVTKAALIFDKRPVYVGAMGASGIFMIITRFTGIKSIPYAIFYVIVVSLGISAYWLFIFNFLYDFIDIDEYKTGRKRDGIIMSYYSLLLKLGGAVASLILGVILQKGGFDSEAVTQSVQAKETIASLFTIYPGIFMFLSGTVMLLSPASRKRMDALHKAQENKSLGKEYSESGFKELLK